MARITDIGLSGSLGTLIFYKDRGIQRSRTRPDRVRLSKASRESARLFGMAAVTSATIRQEIVSLLPAEKDPKIMYGLNAMLFQWLKGGLPQGRELVTRPRFVGLYPFIDGIPAWAILRVPPEIHWGKPCMVTITLPRHTPETQIMAPHGFDLSL